MPTVRVSEALRYASKFVGLVLVATIVAGSFVAGGAYLAADAISLTDPSISALSETPVFIGIVLFAIGVILGAIGWTALVYKFLVDANATAMAARGVGESVSEVSASAKESQNPDAGTSDSTAAPSTPSSTAVSGSGVTAASEDETQPESSSGDAVRDTAGADRSTQASETTDSTTVDAVGDADTEAPADTEQASTGAEPEQDEPPEWTPPDPSEFESAGSTDGSDTGTASDQWTDETVSGEAMDTDTADRDTTTPAESDATTTQDPEEIDDDATLADEGVESFSTASEDDPLSDRLPSDDDS